MAWMSTRYAARSVSRNLRRTVLSIVGIAVGCVLALYMESLNRGRGELFSRAGAARSVPGVAVATARIRAQVLLAVGTHVVPVEMVGVEPDVEPRTFRYVQRVGEGRYLRTGESGALVYYNDL